VSLKRTLKKLIKLKRKATKYGATRKDATYLLEG
jgi:hypothetical protein